MSSCIPPHQGPAGGLSITTQLAHALGVGVIRRRSGARAVHDADDRAANRHNPRRQARRPPSSKQLSPTCPLQSRSWAGRSLGSDPLTEYLDLPNLGLPIGRPEYSLK